MPHRPISRHRRSSRCDRPAAPERPSVSRKSVTQQPRACCYQQQTPPLNALRRPIFAPQNYPSPFTNPQTRLRVCPWPHPTYHAKPHPDHMRCFSTINWTDRPTDGQVTIMPLCTSDAALIIIIIIMIRLILYSALRS